MGFVTLADGRTIKIKGTKSSFLGKERFELQKVKVNLTDSPEQRKRKAMKLNELAKIMSKKVEKFNG